MLIIILIVIVSVIFIIYLISRSGGRGADLKEINRMIEQGVYEKAKSILQKALHSDKFSPDAHYLLAKIYSHVNQDEYALMELKLIIKYNEYGTIGSRDKIFEMMGDLYLKLQKLDEAHQHYLMLEKLHPQDYHVALHLGKVLSQKKRFEEAIGYFNKALGLRSNDDMAIGGIGMCYFQMGDMKKAKDNLEQAVQLNQKNFLAHYSYGLYYHKHQLFDSAISEYEKSLFDKSLRLKALFGIASAYQEKEVNVRAIEYYEQSVNLIEETGDKMRDFNKRTAYFSSLFNIEIRYRLALVYFYDKNFASALEQWQEIDSVSPNYKDVRQKINENLRFGKDRLQDFLIMKEMDFEKISRYMVDYLGYIIKKLKVADKEQILIEAQGGALDVFEGITLIMVKRSFNPVGEREVSLFYNEMQRNKIKTGLIISAAGASPTGLRFVLGKPIDFVGKNQVMRLLKKFEHRI